MANLQVSIDKKRWEETIQQYVGYTRKTAEEATYRQAKNLLFFLSRELPTSRFKRGQPVSRLSDYFKYNREVAGAVVSKILAKRGPLTMKAGYHTRKGITGRAYMTQGKNGKGKFAGWQRDRRTVYFTKEMAIKKNAEIRRSINARFGFIQLLPLKAVDALKVIAAEHGIKIGSVRLSGDKPGKKNRGSPAMVKVTKTGERVDMSMVSAYEYKSKTTLFGKPMAQSAEWYNQQFRLAFPKALSNTIKDMREYMAKKSRKQSTQWTEAEKRKYQAAGRGI